MSEHAFYSVICRDPPDLDISWMTPVQGESPLVQVIEPYDNFDMVTPAIRSEQSTPADNTRKRVWQYIHIIIIVP